ncbi:DoxX family protein [Rhizohabitans arisaemae]|uniref:DoxX family protein n=1 Tax=Rhizohabitans arisaemae TaxID=2720610 RepID=UPI0024B0AE12|nr:DoxX family protein [Rhizohabitans arisaemae]
MSTAAVVLSVLLALAFTGAGFPKVTGKAEAVKALARMGVSAGLTRTIGALELLGALGLLTGLWIGVLGVAAAAGLALLMLGAAGYHIRYRDGLKDTFPSIALLVFSAVTGVIVATTL